MDDVDMIYVTAIQKDFESGRLRRVEYTDYEPDDKPGFTPAFAAQFNCPVGSEPAVRAALDYLEQMGVLDVDSTSVRPATDDRKQYPAELRVVVQPR